MAALVHDPTNMIRLDIPDEGIEDGISICKTRYTGYPGMSGLEMRWSSQGDCTTRPTLDRRIRSTQQRSCTRDRRGAGECDGDRCSSTGAPPHIRATAAVD